MQSTIPQNPRSTNGVTVSVWKAIRWPALGLVFAGVLFALAYLLDRGSAGQRDAALLIGSVALYGVVPLSAIWLIVVASHLRRRPRI